MATCRGVQRHVAALNSLGGQRPQRGHVLRQSDRDDDLGQLRGRVHIHEARARPAPLDALGSAPPTIPTAIGISSSPMRSPFSARRQVDKRCVPATSSGVGVGACLDRPPVVAGGDHDRIHTVHDALVVSGRPVRIGRGKGPGFDDPVSDRFTRVF